MRKMCCSQPVIFKSLVPIQFLFTNPHPRRYAKKNFNSIFMTVLWEKMGLEKKKTIIQVVHFGMWVYALNSFWNKNYALSAFWQR